MTEDEKRRAQAKKRRRQALKQKRERKRREEEKKTKRKKIYITIAACLLLCTVAGGAVLASGILGKAVNAKVILAAESQTMVQDDEIQVFTAKVKSDTNVDRVINKNTGFTVQDLLDDLNSGIGYEISCDGDGTIEGEFPIRIKLDEYLQERISSEWKNKVKVETVDGELVVQNKYGQWDGSRFKRNDGSYVSDDFIESRGDKYYFDADGNLVTGEMKKGFTTYEFGEDGKLLSEVSTLDVNKPMVALTYDDGPGSRTGELLDILESNEAHATFFVLGQCINDGNGSLLKRMVDIGCEVANHSFSHPQLTKLSDEGIKDEINKTSQRIKENSGGTPATLLRPPYGAVNDTVRQAAGMPLIMWSVDTLDWKTRNAQATFDHVINTVRDGDIILLHDIHDATIDASQQLIPKLKEAGYQLVTVSELAEARGVTLEAGQSYAEFWRE